MRRTRSAMPQRRQGSEPRLGPGRHPMPGGMHLLETCAIVCCAPVVCVLGANCIEEPHVVDEGKVECPETCPELASQKSDLGRRRRRPGSRNRPDSRPNLSSVRPNPVRSLGDPPFELGARFSGPRLRHVGATTCRARRDGASSGGSGRAGATGPLSGVVSPRSTPTPLFLDPRKHVQQHLKKCCRAARRASRTNAGNMLAILLPAGRGARQNLDKY